MKEILTYILVLSCLQAAAQKVDHQWIYNWARIVDSIDFPELTASVLDFNKLPPSIYKNWDIELDFIDAHASLCDEDGQLILYSNAQSVHGQSHQPIINGDTINFSRIWSNFTWLDENGEEKPQGLVTEQIVAFIPQPETDIILCLYQDYSDFNLDNNNPMILRMSKIDMNAPSGPTITEKDILINDSLFVRGKLMACAHANGRDWWLLQFSEDQVYIYLIDPNGLSLDHKEQLPFEFRKRSAGQFKFSPDGSKIATFGIVNSNSDEGMDFFLSDFDRCDGTILNPQMYRTPSHNNFIPNGLAFSPNSRYVYVTHRTTIDQYDAEASDFLESRVEVAEHNMINYCSIDNGPGPKSFGQMQIGPDNKIYISLAAQCNDIHIIDRPDVKGVDCQVRQNAIFIPSFVFGTIPNFNTLRLGPIDGSPCDTLDMDNIPVSRFWYEQDSMDYLTAQLWDVSYYRPESWSWTFGDGLTSTERHPVHTYAEEGVYEVCLTVGNENDSHTSCKTLNLGISDISDTVHLPEVSLFPNPTEGPTRLLVSDYLPKIGQVRVYSIDGRIVYSSQIWSGANTLDLSGLDIGTYVYEVRDGDVIIGGGKLVRI